MKSYYCEKCGEFKNNRETCRTGEQLYGIGSARHLRRCRYCGNRVVKAERAIHDALKNAREAQADLIDVRKNIKMILKEVGNMRKEVTT